MGKYNLKKTINFLMSLMLIINMLVVSPVNAKTTASRLNRLIFIGEEMLIHPISSAVGLFDGAVGVEDGKSVMYTTVNGTPSVFNVIDIENNKLLRSFKLEGANQTWVHEVAPDGTAYIGTNGTLPTIWSYSPVKKNVEKVAEIKGEGSIWAMVTDELGNVYIGTYPGGKVFKYNPVNKEILDYGRMVGAEAQEYVRSIAYYKGYIYAGTNKRKIFKLDVKTGEKVDITEVDLLSGEKDFCYDLDVADKYLFARYSATKNLYIYDMEEGKWVDKVIKGAAGLHVSKPLNDKVYFLADGSLKNIDLNTMVVEDTGIKYGSSLRGADWIDLKNNSELPGINLVTMQYAGNIVFFNLETKKVKLNDPVVAPSAADIQSLEKGSDGRIYMSGYTSSTASAYNPSTKTNSVFSLGQAEGIASFENKIIAGVYPHAEIFEFDTTLPAGKDNPKKLFTIGEEQDRPFKITTGDGKIFFGTIPEYGRVGGALTVYNPKDSSYKVFRNVVQDQSIVGLAYNNGKLYGSTTIFGGLGSTPTATEAKMFVWDVDKEEKIAEFSLQLEGLGSPKMISGLTFGPDGLLWGGANGFIFAIDTNTNKIVKSKNIYPEVKDYGMWRPIYLRWSSDGLLYANIAGKLTVIDPETLDSKYLVETPLFTLGDDGNIYFAKGSTLNKIKISYKQPAVLELDGPQYIEKGKEFEVTVKAANVIELYAMEIYLSYDSEKFDIVDVKGVDEFSKDAEIYHNISKDMVTIRVNKTGLEAAVEDTEVVRIKFKALSETERTEIKLHGDSLLMYRDGFESKISFKNGEDKSIALKLVEPVPTPVLGEVTLSAPKTVIVKGDTSVLTLTGKLTNGEAADMKNSEVEYVVSNPEIISVKDGVITAIKPGNAEVYAMVKVNGVQIKSNVVTIMVEEGHTDKALPKTGSFLDASAMSLLGILIFAIGVVLSGYKKGNNQ